MANIKAKNIEECATLFEIEVTAQDIAAAFGDVYSEIDKIANIPGFRAGKAPKDLVRKHYAENAKDEVLKRLIADAYRLAIEEHKITPVGYPEISDMSLLEEGKPLTFKAKVETRPKIKVKNYKGIKAQRKKTVVKEEDVLKMLESLQELHGKYAAVEDRPVQMGDYVVSDLEGTAEGRVVYKKRENVWLFIDKASVIPGLHEGMVGMKKGDDRQIEATLPDAYPDKTVAGKKALFLVKAKEIKMKALPALDDEFAKDLGKESLDAVKREVHEELERRMKAGFELEVENQVLKKLLDEHIFPVPRSLLERQLKYMVEDGKERLAQKGFSKEDLDKKENEFKEKFKADAERQVRLFFILDEVAVAEKIEVGTEDLAEAYRQIASQTNKNLEEVRRQYEKDDRVGDLEERIRESKTIDFLVKAAEVVETDK